MQRIVMYHNPACGNSRAALELLSAQGVAFDLVEYLKTPPDRETLGRIVAMLDCPPAELVRKDRRFQELRLRPENYTSAEAVVGLLTEHPELMQRPVLVRGNRALIARPPEKVLAFLES